MNQELRKRLNTIQLMLCCISEALEGLTGDQLQYTIGDTDDFLAGELLRLMGCKVEFYPDQPDTVRLIQDAKTTAEIEHALVQGALVITLPPESSNV